MTTATIIVLSALLGISLCLNLVASASKQRLIERLYRYKNRIGAYKGHMESQCPRYYATVAGDCPHIWFVCRSTSIGGETLTSTVKLFDTDDAEYNRNEAEELAEKLNDTLCYD